MILYLIGTAIASVSYPCIILRVISGCRCSQWQRQIILVKDMLVFKFEGQKNFMLDHQESLMTEDQTGRTDSHNRPCMLGITSSPISFFLLYRAITHVRNHIINFLILFLFIYCSIANYKTFAIFCESYSECLDAIQSVLTFVCGCVCILDQVCWLTTIISIAILTSLFTCLTIGCNTRRVLCGLPK